MNPDEPPKLAVYLLGAPELRRSGELWTVALSAKTRALLYYLLVTQQPQSRIALATLLWSEHADPLARASLRKAISELRSKFGAYLQLDDDIVSLRPNAPITVDANTFAALSTADAPDWDAYTRAVECYRGEFLAGFAVRNAPNFDAWLRQTRAALQAALLRCLEWLLEQYVARGDLPQAIALGEQILAEEPWREAAHRRLMVLLAESGQRGQALRQFERCRAALRAELAVEPAEATQLLYERLVRLDPPAARESNQFLTRPDYALVGRQAEWRTLLATWRAAADRNPHLVLISGEAGIGKTRLAEELLVSTERQGIASARTRSYAAAGSLAYTPLIEWLRSRALQSARRALDDLWLTEVARLLPELLNERPALPPPTSLNERWQRQRFFEALARLVLAHERPLLLVIDDLQWCDIDTLEWLRYLFHFASAREWRQAHASQWLVVGTVRDDEVDDAHPLHTLLRELRRADQLTEIGLKPLDRDESVELASQVGNRALDAAAGHQLFNQSEGNPLFIAETVRAETGDWRVETGQQRSEPTSTNPNLPSPVSDLQPLPPKVQAVIQSRLAGLSAVARRVVAIAATLGRSFTFALLQAAGELAEEDLVRSLGELWQRRIVREQAIHTYDFSHDRIREVAYAAISPVQRPILHRRAARALEAIHAEDLDPVSALLAGHYEQAGLFEQAVDCYQQAAQVTQQLFAHTEALTYLEAGLALLDRLSPPGRYAAQKLQLLLMLDRVVNNLEGTAPLRRTAILLRARELATQYQDDDALLDVFNRLAFFYQACGELQEARKIAQEHLQLAQRTGEPMQCALAHLRLGIVAMGSGAFQEAHQAMTRAQVWLDQCEMAVRETLTWQQHCSYLDRYWVNVVWIVGFPDRAQEIAHSMLSQITILEPSDHANVPFFAAILYRNLKAHPLLAQQAAALIRAGEEYQNRMARQSGMVFRGWLLAHEGALREGIALSQRGIAGFRQVGHTMFQTHRLAMMTAMHLMANQLDAAQQVLDEAFAISQQSGENFWDVELYRLQGDLLLAQGAPGEQAEQAYLQAIAVAQQQVAKSLELRSATSLARLWQRQGKRGEAYELLYRVYSWFTEGFATADLQTAQALLAELRS